MHLEETTRAQHGALIRTHVMPAFGDRPLASITEMQVQSFVSDLLAKGLAPSTVSKVLGILSQILKAATRNQLIARNPCDGVVGPEEKPQEERIFLTPEELGALADEIGAQFRPMVLVAGYRGLRFGELAGLRPRRLNLLLGKLVVAEALKESRGQLYFGLPKHDRVRNSLLAAVPCRHPRRSHRGLPSARGPRFHQPGRSPAAAVQFRTAYLGARCPSSGG